LRIPSVEHQMHPRRARDVFAVDSGPTKINISSAYSQRAAAGRRLTQRCMAPPLWMNPHRLPRTADLTTAGDAAARFGNRVYEKPRKRAKFPESNNFFTLVRELKVYSRTHFPSHTRPLSRMSDSNLEVSL